MTFITLVVITVLCLSTPLSKMHGVTPGATRAACIGHSMDDSDTQVHNAMSHNILA